MDKMSAQSVNNVRFIFIFLGSLGVRVQDDLVRFDIARLEQLQCVLCAAQRKSVADIEIRVDAAARHELETGRERLEIAAREVQIDLAILDAITDAITANLGTKRDDLAGEFVPEYARKREPRVFSVIRVTI